ncbi:hypothetical protein [Devosia nitrariae]|uniref:Glycosyltransferase RgtA/B/C/D-like domain-containing protein n=1 Tax=Devosia nitrariae TaxID=2071872 RepID=A0ABQ5W376_9HYPH|nr:hypothetical protein [Devosia nitrariae]GLQ54508.1 hypothetical protein GCM10010862_17670 [Devosia nitrariae]
MAVPTDEIVQDRAVVAPLSWAFVALVPLTFLLVGLVLRFLAFRAALPEAPVTNFAQALCRWDCHWYVRIAEEGYDPFPVPGRIVAGNWAFFPLYPGLVGLVRQLLPFPTMVTATLVSLACAYAAAVAAWPLLAGNRRAYVLYAAFLLAGPFSVYFTTFMTEVMFTLLTIGVFLALRQSNHLVAGALAALLSATRIVGVFIVFAIVLAMFLDHRRQGGTLAGFVPALLRRPVWLLAIVISPLGAFAYIAFLDGLVGDGLAFQHVQRAWGRELGNPLGYLAQALTTSARSGFFPSIVQQQGFAALAGLGMTGVLAWRRRLPEALFSLVCILVPLSAGMASMPRFVAGLAPVCLMAMTLLAARWWLFALALLVLLVGGYFGAFGWITEYVALV